MKIQFIKSQCCRDAGRVVEEIEGDDLTRVARDLLTVCNYRMGDNCRAYIVADIKQAWDEYGEDIPVELITALQSAQSGVLVSSNGGDDTYLPLSADPKERAQQIIDDLTGCDWPDCRVEIMAKKALALQDAWNTRNKLRAEGNKLWAEGDKLWAEGDKLWAEGDKLRAEGDKLRAEGNKLWAEAIIKQFGNITLEWKNWHEDKCSHECHLSNGEVYVP